MHPLEQFLGQVNYIHGPGVAETSTYGALETLLNAVGEDLSPRVLAVMQLKSVGAGIPDGGLFTADQFPRGADVQAEAPDLLPERGAIEVKSPADDLSVIAQGDQVARYLQTYRQVLLTNLRAFVLMGLDRRGNPVELESYTLAPTEAAFWELTAHPRAAARRHGERLAEYLRRVMLHPAPLATPEALADLLASYAREARARVAAAMEGGTFPALAEVRQVLEETLGIDFRGEKGDHFFRATLVQTLFYGVFAAWVLWHEEHRDPDQVFDWRTASYTLHVPLVQALFERIAVPSRLRELDLIEVLDWAGRALNRVDRATFFERFQQERAVQYFYEPFLEAYDPQLRKDLGVWYTPPEVVDYMVARADTVLREELDLPDGLADPRVHVLDPACGTGAYLVSVLERIAETLQEKGGDALLAQDLKEAALGRVYGFEILPAPFVVAHLQLGLLLRRWGLSLARDERAAVYLTNALTGWEPPQEEKTRVLSRAFQRERAAAERVKQEAPILVILGNPPYDSFAGMAVGEERALSEAYRSTKRGPDPRGQGLNDLYVRFYRMAERRIVEGTGKGIVCFISNYSWLDGLSHPGMRERYLEVFDRIWIDSLNGDKYRTGKTTPEGKPDPSIFSTPMNPEGIQVGTAIALLARRAVHQGVETVHFRDIWGKGKWDVLREDAGEKWTAENYVDVTPSADLGYPFRPLDTGADYLDWPKLADLFPAYFPGIKTSRDAALVEIDREKLVARMETYFDPDVSSEEVARIAPALMKNTSRFKAGAVREHLTKRKEGFLRDNVVRYAYRPLDYRWLYWEPETNLLDRERPEYYPQVFDGNVWIVTAPKARRDWSAPQFIRCIGSLHLEERGASCFPLLLKEQGLFADLETEPRPNLSDDARAYLDRLEAEPEDLFYHALAILHAPAYREENAGALRQDWPRVPLPAAADALRASAALGRRVAALLDPEEPVPGVTTGAIRPELKAVAVVSHVRGEPLDPAQGDLAVTAGWGYLIRGDVTMPGQGRLVEHDDAVDVYLNEVAYWHNVPRAVWEYTLGGYPVLKKWLSYREEKVLGRALAPEEVRAFTAIARRIAAILALHPALDGSYEVVRRGAAP